MWYVTYKDNDILHANSKSGSTAANSTISTRLKKLATADFKKRHPKDKLDFVSIVSINTRRKKFVYYASYNNKKLAENHEMSYK